MRIKKVNKLAIRLKKEFNKRVVAIRVFTNCLCLYFQNGGTRFYSKMNQAWGKVGNIYFVTYEFNKDSVPSKLANEFHELFNWAQQWSVANFASKLWLTLEYNLKYEL